MTSPRDVDKWTPTRATDSFQLALGTYLMRVNREAQRLLAEHPHLEGESPDVLFSRYITRETAPGYESVLRRAAFAVLHLRAVDRAEQASPFTGDAA